MIFDSNTAKLLYIEYASTHDPVVLERLHGLANDLISVIAVSLNKDWCYEDLVQEGHLKFHQIIIKQQFRIDSPAAMYTFLSKVLRNHMIDYLRKIKDCADLDSMIYLCAADYQDCDTEYNNELFEHYYPDRFPTLQRGFAYAEYVYEAILECINRNKIVDTLVLDPKLSRPYALAVYRSVNSFLRITSTIDLTPQQFHKPLSYAHNGKEFTLYPECLLAGCDCILTYTQLTAHVDRLRIALRGTA